MPPPKHAARAASLFRKGQEGLDLATYRAGPGLKVLALDRADHSLDRRAHPHWDLMLALDRTDDSIECESHILRVEDLHRHLLGSVGLRGQLVADGCPRFQSVPLGRTFGALWTYHGLYHLLWTAWCRDTALGACCRGQPSTIETESGKHLLVSGDVLGALPLVSG